MKRILSVIGVCAVSLAGATPTVSNVQLAENAANGELTVTYDLAEEAAIVTVDFVRDGSSVMTADDREYVRGDADRLVAAGTGRTFTWRPIRPLGFRSGTVTAKVTAWTTANPPDYLVIDLTAPDTRRYYEKAENLPFGGVTNVLYKTDRLVMRKIPATDVVWRMGEPEGGEPNHPTTKNAINPTTVTNECGHMVKLTGDYYIGVYATTRRQYQRLTGDSPSGCTVSASPTYGTTVDAWCAPVDCYGVSYDDLRGAPSGSFASWPGSGHAVAAASKIQTIRSFTGLSGIDLPTEAQWEFACRGGYGGQLNSGKAMTDTRKKLTANTAEVAWYGDETGSSGGSCVHPVGLKLQNLFGLYDMHGNVSELCLDRYAAREAYLATFAEGWESGAVTVDPEGPTDTSLTSAVGRGGDYFYAAAYCRSAARMDSLSRSGTSKHFGFRFVCNLPVEE